MANFVTHQPALTRVTTRAFRALLVTVIVACVAPGMSATTVFFNGSLRTDATVTSCGSLCTLDASNSDGEYAQFATVVDTFTVATTTTMQAITYGYGGGTSLTGAAVAPGGLEPYLSLFDSAGNFIASTYGAPCPAGQTYMGSCYDAVLNGGVLTPGTYQIALSAYFNMSYAENYGSGNLLDGFTGLGNLGAGENLNYAFDVILPGVLSPVPEPNFIIPAGLAVAAVFLCRKSQLRKFQRA